MENNILLKDKSKGTGISITTDNIMKVFMYILLPILLIKMLNYLYVIYDTLMVSVSGIGSVKDVVVLTEIKKTFATLGGGIVIGASVLIGQLVGAKNIEKAKTVLNTTFYILLLISVLIVGLVIPFTPTILSLMQTPEEIISSASGYFIIQMLCVVVEMFNTLFSGIQKIKGKVSIIFYLNLGVIVIKLALNTLFVYGGFPGVNVAWLAGATLIAESFMFIFAIRSLLSKKTELCVSKPNFKFPNLKTILNISLPVFLGNFLFHYSKVFINANMAIFFGVGTLSAVGIAGTILTFNQQFIHVIGDTSKTVIAQNYGSKNYSRMFATLKISLVFSIVISTITFLTVTFFGDSLVGMLTQHNSIEEYKMAIDILNIQKYEMLFVLTISCLSALIDAIGRTKITMLVSIVRTLIVRIPLLFYLYYVVKAGYQSAGLLLVISNAVGAVLIVVFGVILIVKIKNDKDKSLQDNSYVEVVA